MSTSKLMMLAGFIIMIIGFTMFEDSPLQAACSNPIAVGPLSLCITSPGTIGVLVGAVLMIIGFIGPVIAPYLMAKNNS